MERRCARQLRGDTSQGPKPKGSQLQPGYAGAFRKRPCRCRLRSSIRPRSIRVQSSPFRIGVQRASLCSRARISAGVSGVSPAASTASGNLAAEAGARQERGGLRRQGRWEQGAEDRRQRDRCSTKARREKKEEGKVRGRVERKRERKRHVWSLELISAMTLQANCSSLLEAQLPLPGSQSQDTVPRSTHRAHESHLWDFPGGPVVKTLRFHCRGAWVPPLVRELRSRMQQGAAKKKKRPFVPIPLSPAWGRGGPLKARGSPRHTGTHHLYLGCRLSACW